MYVPTIETTVYAKFDYQVHAIPPMLPPPLSKSMRHKL